MITTRWLVLALALVALLSLVPPSTPQRLPITYYVSPSGNDSHTCTMARDAGTPRQTPNETVKCLAGGDTLVFLEGLYERASLLSDAASATAVLPAGLSASQHTVVRAAPGAKVVLRPTDRTFPGGGGVITLTSTATKYVTFDGFAIDGNVVSPETAVWTEGVLTGGTVSPLFHSKCILQKGPTQITYRNLTLYNCGEGFQGGGQSRFENIHAHSNGLCVINRPSDGEDTDLLAYFGKCFPPIEKHLLMGHAFYVSSSDNVFDRLHVHHNGAYGLQWWGGTARNNNVLRNSWFHHNGQTSLSGAIAYGGSNNTIVNNVIHDEHAGIVLYTGSPTLIAHNTLYRIGHRAAPRDDRAALYLRDAVAGKTRVLHNLVMASVYPVQGKAGVPVNTDVSTTIIDVEGRTVVNAATLDFRLPPDSPASTQRPVLPEVQTDIRGVTRRAADAGAYAVEQVPAPPPPIPEEPPPVPPTEPPDPEVPPGPVEPPGPPALLCGLVREIVAAGVCEGGATP